MRALFITSAYPAHRDDPRGVFIHRLARALRRQGLELTVLAPGAPDAPPREVIDGVEVERVPYWIPRWQRLASGIGGIVPNLRRRPWLAFQVPPLVAALTWRALRRASAFDVVHAHWVYPAGIAGAVAARRRKRPLVVTAHGSDLNLATRSRALRWVSRRVSHAADVCVGVSHAICERFLALGVPSDRVTFAPLGVDPPDSLPAAPPEAAEEVCRYERCDGFRVIYVGRLIPLKSVETLLEAHHELERRGHRVACAVVGSGPSEDALRAIVRRNSSRNVFFAGAQAPGSVSRWLSAAQVLVLPSLSEGRGLVILEAMAHGLPVVASDIPGPRELVADGKTGLLFPPRDAPGLAHALEILIRDEGLRHEMGRRGRELVEAEGLTSEQVARSHIALYEDLCAARRKGTVGGVP